MTSTRTWPYLLGAVAMAALWLAFPHRVAAEEAAEVPVLYVSTQGNDAWSGRLPVPNAGKTDGPLATLEGARDAVRAYKTAGAKIVVRGGSYYRSDAFALEEQDSGTPDRPVRYVAYRGETPVLYGGVAVNNWKPYKGKILQADLRPLGLKFTGGGTPWTGWSPGTWVREPISQLFFKHRRMLLARYPNYDPKAPWGGGFLYIDGITDPPARDRFLAQASELRQWSNPQDAEVFYFANQCYISEASRIKSIDRATGEIALADPSWTTFKKGNRYYFQNVFEELDAPGEWYWDRETNVLYFYPPESFLPGDIIIPTVGQAISVTGASNVVLEGFTIEAYNGTAVGISGEENCVLARCTIRNIGGYGVAVSGGSRNGVEGCDIHDTGGTAISVSGGDRKNLVPARNFAVNNHIYHMGVLRKGDSAISISGCGNRVAHNTIHDIPRIGIIFGGNDNIVEYNHIHHCNLEIEDTGAIYLGGVSWTIRGDIIRYNRIHDTGGYGGAGDRWHYPYYCWGIYLDDWASGAQVYGNLVYRTYYAGIHNHSGRDNIYENNVLVDGKMGQILYSAWPTTHSALPGMLKELQDMGWPPGRYRGLERMKDARKDATQSFNSFHRNIVYYNDAESLLYICNDLVFDEHASDYNLVYNHGNPLRINLPGVPVEEQWGKWQEMGLDTHSVVADPQFVDPAHDDYRLKPTSPALRLGFQPLPIEKMGCQPGPRRATWPLESPLDCMTPVGIYHPELVASPSTGKSAAPARTGAVPRHIARRVTAPVTVDGEASPGEWDLDPKAAMVIARAPGNEQASKRKSYAWAQHDDRNLYLLVVNEVDPDTPLMLGSSWGGQDAVEFAFRDPQAKGAPIYNLRGFSGGAKGSVCDAGASSAQAQKVGEAMTFAASREKGKWVGEFCVPLASAGIDLAKLRTLQFNINVRRMADESWMVWTDTGAQIWQVAAAGEILWQR